MLTGKTSTGFEFTVDENVFDDMELIDKLVEADKGNVLAMANFCDRVLGNQKPALFEHVRVEDGRVPISAVIAEISEIANASKNGKKS